MNSEYLVKYNTYNKDIKIVKYTYKTCNKVTLFRNLHMLRIFTVSLNYTVFCKNKCIKMCSKLN